MTIRSSLNFELRQTGNRFFVRCLDRETKPRALRVSQGNADYLRAIQPDGSFEAACIIDIGCGIWQR